MFQTMSEIHDEDCPSCISGEPFSTDLSQDNQEISIRFIYRNDKAEYLWLKIGHTGCTPEAEECNLPGLCEGELIHLEGEVATEQECQVNYALAKGPYHI